MKADFADADTFARWVKVHDRVRAGEMPPKKADQPSAAERDTVLKALATGLSAADTQRQRQYGRVAMRRLNRAEYESTIRDLFALPGLQVREMLPEDGRLDGFDKAKALIKGPQPARTATPIVDEHEIGHRARARTRDAVETLGQAIEFAGDQRHRAARNERHGPASSHPHGRTVLKIVTEETRGQKVSGGAQPPQLIVHQRNKSHPPREVIRELKTRQRNEDVVGHDGS